MEMLVSIRIVSIICCIALLALNAWSLFSEPRVFHSYSAGVSLALAAALLVIMFLSRGKRAESGPPKGDEATLMTVPAANNQAEAEIVSFLASLQERGRLVDFLMEDITTYDDAGRGRCPRRA
jgi:hypothetical protein